MAFTTTLIARFYDNDAAGIVFFGRIYQYAHAAFEDLVASAFGSWGALFGQSSWLMPVVHSEADYAGPIRTGDVLTVSIDFERRGRSSMTFRYRITCGNETRVVVGLTHACVDRQNFKPVAIPEDFLWGLKEAGLAVPEPIAK